ncbi:imidazole glycerol phosphate synthase subunit HisH [Telmatocola sphagniphila]|uniref:Imidazole glycerol phosphate synthase subunit HisH n=1 Tax=Telmatocola sphagniphila TaxID=1123043 RepID=A0A8E6B544_9BACT|nr:imidazole glycerol phosphate synthase subunit HisH [Telmatocola sphagniphila]QVL30678.1 imidazole glycerol phosphate synthase subunit HisH [Telmatocola sphagniphila]
MAKIAIVDYGMANLRSVQKAFERVGHEAVVTSDLNELAEAEKLVLPGVGAFKDAIAKLRETGLDQLIDEHIAEGRLFLGICLGFQMLFTRSSEDGLHAGLDIFPGEVVRFAAEPGLKVPHMGWNQIKILRNCPLFQGLPPEPDVYFVHSYYVKPMEDDLTITETCYPKPFTSAIWRDNLFATQFHPEKSQNVGLKMLQNFAEM